MVLKEWACKNEECERTFEALVNTCPYCGTRNAARVFLTPVGINGGRNTRNSARSIDRILDREFKLQGIANFSNCGGENKVSWARRVNAFSPRTYNSPIGIAGAPGQAPIQAFCGRPGDFSAIEKSPLNQQWGFAASQIHDDGVWPSGGQAPTIDQGMGTNAVDMVTLARHTQLPAALARATTMVHKR